MENLDVTVLRHLRDWRAAGRRALLATVVRTWGSSPRPVGSILALREDGAVVGSVSGGCIEDDLIHRAAEAWPAGPPAFVSYGVSADEAHRFGLPCGGTLELLLEHEPDAAGLAELVRMLDEGRLVRRHVRLADGRVRLAAADAPEELRVDLGADGGELANTFGPAYRLLLIGAGQLAEVLASTAIACGFAVTVCDPREEYRGAWNVPGATLVTDMPDDAVRAFRPDRRSGVVALTHDPKLDDLALLEALDSEAFYVGAIGSRRNQSARRARLAEHFGLDRPALERLRGPIGLYIGSKTPPEIAISVLAEILALKNGVALPAVMGVAEAKNRRAAPMQQPELQAAACC
ncbi:XdhC family protein [Ideonella sp.]|uniref:XdhC family protein n=1 Tax=Ideonella sp. TaxID=1929293 RepID=UPI002B46F16A|nr:XdhC family protein [Ideonella sp.]HJV68980.1 XdhC family protein [Ideonella sp.]